MKTLPRAILIGIPLVTLLYVGVNISYLTVLSPTDISRSSAVAVVTTTYHNLFLIIEEVSFL
jgi:L-type amino acid transporter 9